MLCLPKRLVRPLPHGFTLLEICLAIMIMMLALAMAVPALSGVFMQRDVEESFAQFDECVAEARRRSVAEGRAYLVLVSADGAEVRLDGAGEEGEPVARFDLEKGEALAIEFPAAMRPPTVQVWTFWPNGACEPAVVRFAYGKEAKSDEGGWVASYNPLTGRAEVVYE